MVSTEGDELVLLVGTVSTIWESLWISFSASESCSLSFNTCTLESNRLRIQKSIICKKWKFCTLNITCAITIGNVFKFTFGKNIVTCKWALGRPNTATLKNSVRMVEKWDIFSTLLTHEVAVCCSFILLFLFLFFYNFFLLIFFSPSQPWWHGFLRAQSSCTFLYFGSLVLLLKCQNGNWVSEFDSYFLFFVCFH